MATDGLKEIIGKALTDADYRQQLINDPDSIIGEYELADEESIMLRNLQADAFEEMDVDVEERQSKSGLGMGLGSLITGRDASSGEVGVLIDVLMNKYG